MNEKEEKKESEQKRYAVAFKLKIAKYPYDNWEPVSNRKYTKKDSAEKVKKKLEEKKRKEPEEDYGSCGKTTKLHMDYKVIEVDKYGRPINK